MVKIFAAFIFSFLLMPQGFSWAQSHDHWSSKTYEGRFHESRPNKKEPEHREASVEFESPIPFSHELVTALPEKLTYFIRFKNGDVPFEKFTIDVYSKDGDEYTIDPEAEGKQIGIDEEHPIFDSYLIYLILGQEIDHLEIVNAAGDNGDKYILNKMEIRNGS